MRILVEGGAKLSASLLNENLIDEIAWFRASKIMGNNGLDAISNLNIDAASLNYSIKTEHDFGNKYLYILNEDGTTSDSKISVSFSVKRKEHKNVNYKNSVHSDKCICFS